jgi:GT2 family glycosyltransferase
MSTADNIEIVKQAYAAWNAHDPDQYVQLIADDYVWDTDFFPAPVRGAEETKKAMSVYFTAFPDLRITSSSAGPSPALTKANSWASPRRTRTPPSAAAPSPNYATEKS